MFGLKKNTDGTYSKDPARTSPADRARARGATPATVIEDAPPALAAGVDTTNEPPELPPSTVGASDAIQPLHVREGISDAELAADGWLINGSHYVHTKGIVYVDPFPEPGKISWRAQGSNEIPDAGSLREGMARVLGKPWPPAVVE